MKRMSRKTVLLGVISPALFAVAAMAQTFGFHSSFVGSTPDVTIAGVPSGTSPWAIQGSFAHVINGEKIDVRLRGLVRTDTGTASPVTQVSASPTHRDERPCATGRRTTPSAWGQRLRPPERQ